MKDLSYLINNEKHYISINNYLKDTYHKKVFKISLNGNFTCPNIDGTKGSGGCIYCSSMGSGDFAGNKTQSFKLQFENIVTMMKEKWFDGYYIAYLQANSNTYDTIENLRRKYYEIINLDPNIKIFDIATRPDCINQDVIDLLKEINTKVKVWVELGFQTANEKSAEFINRCYSNDCLVEAVKLLKNANIDVIVHIINGLPNETKEDMINTVKFLNNLKIDGIKIHMLHIMKNTTLADIYLQKPFKVLSLSEYVDIVSTQLRYLSTNIVIHRITGDSPKNMLIEPSWTLKKFVVMNEIDKLMRKEHIYQGDLTNNQSE